MPLVPAKCTQCGATLTIDPSQDAAVCPFCNTPFVVEKAINNYNVTNNTTIGKVEHVSTCMSMTRARWSLALRAPRPS